MSADPPAPAVFEVPCPGLVLGERHFDVRHRAVVVGLVTPGRDAVLAACGLLAEGADAIEVIAGPGGDEAVEPVVAAVEALVAERREVPLLVETSSSRVLAACLAAGAAAGHHPTAGPADSEFLGTVVEGHAAAVVGANDERLLAEIAARAAAAGLARERLVLHADLAGVPGALALGHPVALSTGQLERDQACAAVAMAVGLGCRVIFTRHVRTVRRTVDVIAAILSARGATT